MICRTFPTWNILAYNAIGGNGDELYGIESASYYIRNLALNMNISWPLAVAAPVLLLREYTYGFSSSEIISKGTLFLPAIIWLCVLFSRPHKVRLWGALIFQLSVLTHTLFEIHLHNFLYFCSDLMIFTHRRKDFCIQYIHFLLLWLLSLSPLSLT